MRLNRRCSFCKILDGGKTGITVQQERLKEDMKKRSPKSVPWKQDATEKRSVIDKTNSPCLKRSKGLNRFIMDHLRQAVKEECDRMHILIDERLRPLDPKDCYDSDLGKPWKDFLKNDLGDNKAARKSIEAHVKRVQEKYKEDMTGPDFTSLPIVVRQDRLRALSMLFADGLSDVHITIGHDGHDLATLMASCAYYLDRTSAHGWSRFPFNVAFRTLCDIKAKAVSHGAVKTVSNHFYTSFSIKPSFLHP